MKIATTLNSPWKYFCTAWFVSFSHIHKHIDIYYWHRWPLWVWETTLNTRWLLKLKRYVTCKLIIHTNFDKKCHSIIHSIKYLQIYNLAYDKAKHLLQKNHLVLEKIVVELLEYEILTGKVCISVSYIKTLFVYQYIG